MKSKVLYFPYIRLPRSSWLNKMLLYWDSLGSIVPINYIEDPSLLGGHARSFVQEGLVEQVVPGNYVYDIPNFDNNFINYLQSPGVDLESRRKNFREGKAFKVHINKLGNIEYELEHLRLASQTESDWYDIERETAMDFMSYLATVLGNIERVNARPVTDSDENIRRYVKSGVEEDKIEKQMSSLRIDVLENVLPFPDKPLEAEEIRKFKNKHGDKLSRFRRKVEQELITIVDIDNNKLRQKRLNLFYEEIEEQVNEIVSYLDERGMGRVLLSKFGGVISSLSKADPVGLLKAVYDVFDRSVDMDQPPHFAYAAYAQKELSS